MEARGPGECRHARDPARVSSRSPPVLRQWPPRLRLSVLRQKEDYLNGSFLFYVEKNQNLKDNFGNHTRTADFYSAIKRNQLLIMCKPVADSGKHWAGMGEARRKRLPTAWLRLCDALESPEFTARHQAGGCGEWRWGQGAGGDLGNDGAVLCLDCGIVTRPCQSSSNCMPKKGEFYCT